MSPYSKLYNKLPYYPKLRVCGCLCYHLLRPYNAYKLNYRSKPCMFLGYSFVGYKCLDPITNNAYLSRHVFDETSFSAKDLATLHFPSRLHSTSDSPFPLLAISSFIDESPTCINSITQQSSTTDCSHTTDPNPTEQPNLHPADPNPILPSAPIPCHPMITRSRTQHLDTTSIVEPNPTVESSSTIVSSPQSIAEPILESYANIPFHTMITSSRIRNEKSKTFFDFKMFHSRYPLLSYHTMLSEIGPSCYSKSTNDPRWPASMCLEFEALLSNKTWTLCPRPSHQHVIHNKWVYKKKRRSDGVIDRFKARLVVKGFEQTSGLDYIDTFSLVIKPSTIRVILALAIYFNWMIKQLDIFNAFLHGSLFEEVYDKH